MSFVVSKVESFVVSIPFDHGAEGLKLGGQSWSAIETMLVRITAADGVVGWGEGFGFHLCRLTQRALDTLVASHLIDREVDTPVAWTDAARRSMHNFGMNGPVTYAISAIDIALWDIVGKRAGKPIHQLLGSQRTSMPAYASLMRYGTIADVQRQVSAAVDQGYQRIKLHEIGVAEIKAARSVLTAGQPLMVDVNCAWTTDEAAAIIDQLQDADLAWLEEPTWAPNDFAAMACLRGHGVPIAAGENLSGLGDFKSLIAAKAVDIAQPSVTKVGGISEMMRVVALCGEHGIGVAPHSPYFGPGYVATAHILASAAKPTAIERFHGAMQADIYRDRFRPKDGVVTLSDAPGLGEDPDMSIIERYRVA